jgi:hypothetical protein
MASLHEGLMNDNVKFALALTVPAIGLFAGVVMLHPGLNLGNDEGSRRAALERTLKAFHEAEAQRKAQRKGRRKKGMNRREFIAEMEARRPEIEAAMKKLSRDLPRRRR